MAKLEAALLRRAVAEMHEHFPIAHATFQVETAALAGSCRLRPADVVESRMIVERITT